MYDALYKEQFVRVVEITTGSQHCNPSLVFHSILLRGKSPVQLQLEEQEGLAQIDGCLTVPVCMPLCAACIWSLQSPRKLPWLLGNDLGW